MNIISNAIASTVQFGQTVDAMIYTEYIYTIHIICNIIVYCIHIYIFKLNMALPTSSNTGFFFYLQGESQTEE